VTTLRLLLFGRRKPVHRELEWAEEPERVRSVEVQRENESGQREGDWGPDGGPYPAYDPYLQVKVDDVPVFLGYPREAVEVQSWIERARATRLEQLGGQALPSSAADADAGQ